MKQVSTFIEVAFQQDKETYQERKKKAEKVMSNDLVHTFFPTDTYKGDRKTEVDEVEIFIKTGNLTNNQASVFVRFKHTLFSLQSDQKQVSPVFLHINVHREEGSLEDNRFPRRRRGRLFMKKQTKHHHGRDLKKISYGIKRHGYGASFFLVFWFYLW